MYAIDAQVMMSINSIAKQFEIFDRFMTQVLMLPSVRMLPLVACLVLIWFSQRDGFEKRRIAVQGLMGAFIALVASRLIQNSWTYQPRPLHEPSLDFVPPYGVSTDMLREWSSFPSDTTALAFALATAIAIAFPRAGWLAFVWSLVVVGAPRIYAGFHYPSDILGGAFLGIAATLACAPIAGSLVVRRSIQRLETAAPAVLYAIGFMLVFQITILFDDVRVVARAVSTAMGNG